MPKPARPQRVSVIVPENPFTPDALRNKKHCLTALDVSKLMEWWPGTPHSPHRSATKVRDIQRSLDWKRVTQIAAYLLQKEIIDAADVINRHFASIYEPRKLEPGREWPPRVNRVVGYERSAFPTFSNVLLHVNGAQVVDVNIDDGGGAAWLEFNETDPNLRFSVIDGQHRINGAYLAVCVRREQGSNDRWEIPAEVFLDLDPINGPPRNQAQIFIDVNFYQKKVDRSLVADLFPTARGPRNALDQKERAQDLGRALMLERGPLVGMIQIPSIKYGVSDVITLATLNSAIENVLDQMERSGVVGLSMQTDFLAQCLTAWLEASGRFESKGKPTRQLTPQNVAYQGRILVSVISLVPAMIWKLRKNNISLVSQKAETLLITWLRGVARRARLLEGDVFISKDKFKERGFHGSGGIGRFRDSLWAVVVGNQDIGRKAPETISEMAKRNQAKVLRELNEQ